MKLPLFIWILMSLLPLPYTVQLLQHSLNDSSRPASVTIESRIEGYLAAAEFYADSLQLSVAYGTQALQLAVQHKNYSLAARSEQLLAGVYLELDLYDKALTYAYRALTDYEKLRDEQGQLDATGILAWVYYDAGQAEKALGFHKKLLLAYRKKRRTKDVVWTTNAIGLDYAQLQDYTSALKYFNQSLALGRVVHEPGRIAASLNNIGMVQTATGRYREALVSLKEAYRLSVQLDNVLVQSENLNQLGNTYSLMNELDSAEYCLSQARSVIASSRASERKERLVDNYEFSAQLFLKRKHYERAFLFLKQYINLKNDVISIEKTNSLAHALLAYHKRQNEQEIELLESKNKLKVLQRDALTGAILLITIIGVLLYSKQATTLKKERLILETQQSLMQKELMRASLEKDALQANLDFKNSEFTNAAIHLSQRNELIRSFLDELKHLNLRASPETSARLAKIIHHFSQVQEINKDAEAFHLNMENEYRDFIFRLSTRFCDLTENEKRLCAQIRLNLSIKDIASINNISVKSVEMARYRLRKKLGMEHDENLASFLNSL